jgi:hypothetical protein
MPPVNSILNEISVVIPLGLGEAAWQHLLPDLLLLPCPAEIILTGPREPQEFRSFVERFHRQADDVRWMFSEPGRGRQLNAGARCSGRRFLWFLHADSRMPESSLIPLERALQKDPNTLLFFDLAFFGTQSRLMRLNEWGVRFRSRLLKMPFGDQGFCVSRRIFEDLGGFPEDVKCGEDHLFVWKARRGGVPIRPVGAALYTSDRKYRQNGWSYTTAGHLLKTATQAFPQWIRLLGEKTRR